MESFLIYHKLKCAEPYCRTPPGPLTRCVACVTPLYCPEHCKTRFIVAQMPSNLHAYGDPPEYYPVYVCSEACKEKAESGIFWVEVKQT